MLRLRDSAGVTHAATWTFYEWIGRTCGYTFATPRNQWQRRTSEGLLITNQAPYGSIKMIVLEESTHADCMTCIVTEARSCA